MGPHSKHVESRCDGPKPVSRGSSDANLQHIEAKSHSRSRDHSDNHNGYAPFLLDMRPTQALQVGRYRHARLTTKDVGKGFYKGNRTGSMGRHTKYGGYVIEWEKVRTYVVPDMKDFKVRSIFLRSVGRITS